MVIRTSSFQRGPWLTPWLALGPEGSWNLPFGSRFWYTPKKQLWSIPKMTKIVRRGRPSGRIQDRPFQMRVTDEFIASLDDWRRKQANQPSRAEAIRSLVESGLNHLSHSPSGRLSHASRAQASAMAGEVVDRLTDASAPLAEQAKRKRKLIHGPREFREMRQDQRNTETRPTRKTMRP